MAAFNLWTVLNISNWWNRVDLLFLVGECQDHKLGGLNWRCLDNLGMQLKCLYTYSNKYSPSSTITTVLSKISLQMLAIQKPEQSSMVLPTKKVRIFQHQCSLNISLLKNFFNWTRYFWIAIPTLIFHDFRWCSNAVYKIHVWYLSQFPCEPGFTSGTHTFQSMNMSGLRCGPAKSWAKGGKCPCTWCCRQLSVMLE